jgi:SAM-dependent methyltransferase
MAEHDGASAHLDALPIPPHEMRVLVGPTDASAFDNPTGALIFDGISPGQYDSVFDFGCGCGRLARQLLQQSPPPRRYVGVDLHSGMVAWCRQNLAPRAAGFEFLHHDVYEMAFNPGVDKDPWRPLPAEDDSVSLFLAFSVFTHVFEDHSVRYLEELRRTLRADGVAVTTWFFFDKHDFPMMQTEQNSLFINRVNPTNAVIVDREWFVRSLADVGLVATRIDPPTVRGFQWRVDLQRSETGGPSVAFPDDRAPIGVAMPPQSPPDAHLIGLAEAPIG